MASSDNRWNKGRGWDGIGPWSDSVTASQVSELLLKTEANFTFKAAFERVVAHVGEKRALTYLDGKGCEVANYSFSEVCRISQY